MDPNALSKEQLLDLLAKVESSKSEAKNESGEPQPDRCKFQPLRQDQPPCPEEPSTPYGFCKKHRNTVQAKKAEKEWDRVHNPPVSIVVQASPPVPATSVDLPKGGRPSDDSQNAGSQNADNQKSKSSKTKSKNRKDSDSGLDTPSDSDDSSDDEKPKKEESPSEVSKDSSGRTPGGRSSHERHREDSEKSKNGGSSSETEQKPVKLEFRPPKQVKTTKIGANAWGRYEHPETHILFDPVTTVAYGVQDAVTGKVLKLSRSHIEICKQRKWKYVDPKSKMEDSSGSETEKSESNSESESESESSEQENGRTLPKGGRPQNDDESDDADHPSDDERLKSPPKRPPQQTRRPPPPPAPAHPRVREEPAMTGYSENRPISYKPVSPQVLRKPQPKIPSKPLTVKATPVRQNGRPKDDQNEEWRREESDSENEKPILRKPLPKKPSPVENRRFGAGRY